MPFANDCIEMAQTCLNEVQTIQLDQSEVGTTDFVVLDKVNGKPVDLTPYDGGSSESSSSESSSSGFPSSSSSAGGDVKHGVELLVKDLYLNTQFHIQQMLEILNAKEGLVRYTSEDGDELKDAGTYIGALVLWEQGKRRRNIPIFWDVEASLELTQRTGPISIAEVRHAVRDRCPEANFLLDEVEFTNSEIAWAIRRPIDQWNETPPPIGRFETSTFPYRYHWMEAVVAELMYMSVAHMQRNDLPYSAGGISIDDKRKWQDRLPLAQDRRKRWEEWMIKKKVEINIKRGYGEIDSGVYGREYWWWT